MSGPRVTLLVSADFGELSNAVDFFSGQDFQTRLLLPPRLQELNPTVSGITSAGYDSTDVVDRVVESDAELVVLFCGYLFTLNRLFDLRTLERLINTLQARSIPVWTSDPFVGLLRGVEPERLAAEAPALAPLAGHLAQVARYLRHARHLYLTDPGGMPGASTAVCFNPYLQSAPPEGRRLQAESGVWAGLDPTRRRWLFVLAEEDRVAWERRLGGAEAVAGLLAQRIGDAADRGRQAVVVAPPPLLRAVGPTLAAAEALGLPFCALDRFREAVREAEYVFYWNVFSNSAPLRFHNGQACFFFDRGHLARTIPRFYRRAIEHYYAGAEPDLLEQERPLDPVELAQRSAAQIAALLPAARRWHAAPTPRTLVERLLG